MTTQLSTKYTLNEINNWIAEAKAPVPLLSGWTHLDCVKFSLWCAKIIQREHVNIVDVSNYENLIDGKINFIKSVNAVEKWIKDKSDQNYEEVRELMLPMSAEAVAVFPSWSIADTIITTVLLPSYSQYQAMWAARCVAILSANLKNQKETEQKIIASYVLENTILT